MALLDKIFDSVKTSVTDSFKGGLNVRVNGGATVGAPPTQVAFNPMLIIVGVVLLVVFLMTGKRR